MLPTPHNLQNILQPSPLVMSNSTLSSSVYDYLWGSLKWWTDLFLIQWRGVVTKTKWISSRYLEEVTTKKLVKLLLISTRDVTIFCQRATLRSCFLVWVTNGLNKAIIGVALFLQVHHWIEIGSCEKKIDGGWCRCVVRTFSFLHPLQNRDQSIIRGVPKSIISHKQGPKICCRSDGESKTWTNTQ